MKFLRVDGTKTNVFYIQRIYQTFDEMFKVYKIIFEVSNGIEIEESYNTEQEVLDRLDYIKANFCISKTDLEYQESVKDELLADLEEKKVPVTGDETLSELADKVSEIPTDDQTQAINEEAEIIADTILGE